MFLASRMEELGRELRRAATSGAKGSDCALSRTGRRARGAYFTPQPLVDFVVAEALGARLARCEPRWREDGSPELVVLDPAAGDGRFLRATVEYLARRAADSGSDPAGARAAITARCVIGVERDPDFADTARAVLGEGAVVFCREALLDPPELPLVDVVVGNPPYQRSIHLARADGELWRALRGRYAATSHGEWDLYAAFLEQALEWVQPGGEVGLVVPSRWLTAGFASRLRGKLAGAAAVRAIVDFGAEQIFAGATTYASVVFLSRSPSAAVVVARYSEHVWRCGSVGAKTLGAEPWRLAVGRKRELLDHLSAIGPPLGEVARIAKGAGTNADPVYVFEEINLPDAGLADSGSAEIVEVRSKALAGETVELERGLLRPCLRGRDVRAFGDVDDSVECLVPYDRVGRLVSHQELERRWPRTAAYFARCRPLLDKREAGRFRGDEYYRFGRPQNLAYLGDPSPKVVVPDVTRGGRALLDTKGAMALDSTYALRLRSGRSDYSLLLLLAVLNSPIVVLWLAENGISLRGNYLRMKTAYLESLPLPAAPSSWTAKIERALAPVGRGEIDHEFVSELVRRAYGIEPDDWR